MLSHCVSIDSELTGSQATETNNNPTPCPHANATNNPHYVAFCFHWRTDPDREPWRFKALSFGAGAAPFSIL